MSINLKKQNKQTKKTKQKRLLEPLQPCVNSCPAGSLSRSCTTALSPLLPLLGRKTKREVVGSTHKTQAGRTQGWAPRTLAPHGSGTGQALVGAAVLGCRFIAVLLFLFLTLFLAPSFLSLPIHTQWESAGLPLHLLSAFFFSLFLYILGDNGSCDLWSVVPCCQLTSWGAASLSHHKLNSCTPVPGLDLFPGMRGWGKWLWAF